MPAEKRPHNQLLQGCSTCKRHAADSRNAASEEQRTKIIKLLKECSQKQQSYISHLTNFLEYHEPRFQRLRLHLDYHSYKVDIDRILVRNAIQEQIEKYGKEMAALNSKETMLKLFVKEEQKQEDKLQAIYQKVAKYNGHELQDGEKEVENCEPNFNELFKKELNDALKQVPAIKRNDEEMQSLPKLERNDLDDIGWPGALFQWRHYLKYWDSDVEEAAECKDLNKKIQILEKKVEKTLSNFQTAQAQREKIELYDRRRNCPIQNGKIPDYEYSQFNVRLENLIHKFFEKKAFIEKLNVQKRSLEAGKKQRDELMKSIFEDMIPDSLKCSVCYEPLTNGEQSKRCPQQFGSCGHTVCATCMIEFKAQEFPFHWTCHQCRTPSDRILTNWSLMQLIRENDDEDRGEDDEDIEQNNEDSGEDDEDSDEDDYLNVLRVQMGTPYLIH